MDPEFLQPRKKSSELGNRAREAGVSPGQYAVEVERGDRPAPSAVKKQASFGCKVLSAALKKSR